jgi:phenylacetate-coenzyme A ligase PaaK-like adenylate-forming protein
MLALYHRLPPVGRSAVASVHGLRLKKWRFGPETERLVAEAKERESWSPQKWEEWRAEHLGAFLRQSASTVPFYRTLWANRRRNGDRRSLEYLEHWPILSKDELRQDPRRFLADTVDVRSMYQESTSGTSGKPLTLWFDRPTIRRAFAIRELRTMRWHGVNMHEPWAILGGQPVVPGHVSRPPFWVLNAPMSQLYLSANHISEGNSRHYVRAIERHGATHMWCYSSSAAFLAQAILKQGLKVRGIRVVLTNAEPLYPWQREVIEEAFDCRVRETYGQAEGVSAATECPEGRLHAWPEMGLMEVLDDEADSPVEPGEVGRLVSTGLMNQAMPLIRFEVGDRGSFEVGGRSCSCKRTLPVMGGIEGRVNDMLVTRDGRRVFWVNPVLYGLPMREAQIVQESPERVVVRYVSADGNHERIAGTVRDRLRSRLGPTEVDVRSVDHIPVEANGKFRAVKCMVSEEEIARLG